jgi:DNA primase
LADDRVLQIKQANDIVDVVGGYLALRPAGGTFKGLCPFHDDSRPSFDVDPRRQRYRCWACGKHGDVISFVQEFERIGFRESLELLARRVGIPLDDPEMAERLDSRARMMDVMRWVNQQFHECLLDSSLAEIARKYLSERGLVGETVRKWGLGYAPATGHWLVDAAKKDSISFELLETLGLIAPRQHSSGYYDRFRDRVQFPIRDARSQVVGFGGRILPGSPLADRGPKYYNSCDTPLFSKSEQLYGIDQARLAAEKAGYLAIVEGYTDVLMAHQMGVPQVVATMGTALNERHVRQIRRFVPRVVLVYDADEGGDKGVDRALALFASQEMELAIATLPTGLDPCDLLIREGPEPFKRVLTAAVDALEFKLDAMVRTHDVSSIEGRRRVVDAVLEVISLATPQPGSAAAIKTELMVGRVARRLTLKEETIWSRLEELRRSRREKSDVVRARGRDVASAQTRGMIDASENRSAKASPEERRLLEILLAEPELVGKATSELKVEQLEHRGLRRLLAGLYDLHFTGQMPTLDCLRIALDDNIPLLNKAFELQEAGLAQANRALELDGLLSRFRERREKFVRDDLFTRLNAVQDEQAGLELLRELQKRTKELGPDASANGDSAGSTRS